MTNTAEQDCALTEQSLGGLHDRDRGRGMQRAQRHSQGVGLHVHLYLGQTPHIDLLARGRLGSRLQGGGAIDHEVRAVWNPRNIAKL